MRSTKRWEVRKDDWIKNRKLKENSEKRNSYPVNKRALLSMVGYVDPKMWKRISTIWHQGIISFSVVCTVHIIQWGNWTWNVYMINNVMMIMQAPLLCLYKRPALGQSRASGANPSESPPASLREILWISDVYCTYSPSLTCTSICAYSQEELFRSEVLSP